MDLLPVGVRAMVANDTTSGRDGQPRAVKCRSGASEAWVISPNRTTGKMPRLESIDVFGLARAVH